MFEVTLAYGTAAHLHAHTNGKIDPPVRYRSGADTPVPRGNAPGRELGGQISRARAAMAAGTLLPHEHGVRAGTVRITNGVGFDWNRRMDNRVQGRDFRGPGVSEAYVVRRAQEQAPEFMFARTDGAQCYP